MGIQIARIDPKTIEEVADSIPMDAFPGCGASIGIVRGQHYI